MIYADTDFFLAILKESDWLKSSARKLLEAHRGKLITSPFTLVELLLVSAEYKLDPERLIIDALELSELEGGDSNVFLVAASYLKEHSIGVFDALHAASCGSRNIISSDRVFDKLGLTRIAIEP